MAKKQMRVSEEIYKAVKNASEISGFNRDKLLELAWANYTKSREYCKLMVLGKKPDERES